MSWNQMFSGRLFDRVDLIKPVSNVRPSICPSFHWYVRTSTKSFFDCKNDLNEIWHICRGRRVMHDGMQYALIQGQGKGYEPLKVGNPAVFKSWGLLSANHIFYIQPSFLCHVTLKFAQTSVVKSRPLCPYWANFFYYYH